MTSIFRLLVKGKLKVKNGLMIFIGEAIKALTKEIVKDIIYDMQRFPYGRKPLAGF